MAPQTPPPAAPPPLPRPPGDADWRERLDYWRERLIDSAEQTRGARLIGSGVLLVVLAFAALWIFRSDQPTAALEASLPRLDPASVAAPVEPTPQSIVVHVAGAVDSPGLIELESGARVADAVAAVGGATSDADLDRINLALPLADADRVYVPLEGEPVQAVEALPGLEATELGPLDLNRATTENLEQLPGVGPATAAAIVSYRDTNGPFESVSALENVPGIGPAKMARLRDLVAVGP
jgi:competence protein ComEA